LLLVVLFGASLVGGNKYNRWNK